MLVGGGLGLQCGGVRLCLGLYLDHFRVRLGRRWRRVRHFLRARHKLGCALEAQRLSQLAARIDNVIERHGRAGRATLRHDDLFLHGADQHKILCLLLLVAGAKPNIHLEVHIVRPARRVTLREVFAVEVTDRPRGGALDSPVNQAHEALDEGFGKRACD